MIREWRHLKMLKRSGCGYIKDEVEAQNHSCALLCPACPLPGINLPPNWEDAPKEKRFVFKSGYHLLIITLPSWLYALFLALDANFRMSRKGVSSDERDPCLTRNRGYFVDQAELAAHLEAHKGHRQEVSED